MILRRCQVFRLFGSNLPQNAKREQLVPRSSHQYAACLIASIPKRQPIAIDERLREKVHLLRSTLEYLPYRTLEHRIQQDAGVSAFWQPVENVAQSTVQQQHGETVHQRP